MSQQESSELWLGKRSMYVLSLKGSSEYKVSFVVSEDQGPDAVRAIHEEFHLGKKDTGLGNVS